MKIAIEEDVETIPLKCTCGKIQGIAKNITPKAGNHIVCMCVDCQAFAHYLGKSKESLDENGGTHIFQITPKQVEVTVGREHLKCMQMSPKGLKRWYADCCKMPIANTLSFKISFVGLFTTFIDFENTELSKDELLGPIICRGMGKYGKGKLPDDTHQKFPIILIFKMIKTILIGKVIKSYLPNTFFNKETGNAITKEIILSKKEREKLKDKMVL
ncbi:hypothetical protein A9Q84_18850 [Halobacteriovorax marinus]|uniref:CENP-V/GFA domain-containing protein n=1 Tax=Halobacteriovorax marinus TaxID=97084 RepID=A0A1Y5F2V7_9BACT|nr:hypothetical protein A9Q84_18850 [Halobacteriovorax marinus]